MVLVVGLGNPGEKYKRTRHNVGFSVVDVLAGGCGEEEWIYNKKGVFWYLSLNITKKKVIIIKPQTHMNNSGDSIDYLLRKYRDLGKKDLFVVHDDLDLRLGEYKIQKGKGPKNHKGLLSIYEVLGSKDFWHVRVGVDNRKPENRTAGEDYVLQRFNETEGVIIKNVIESVAGQLVITINRE